MNIQLLKVTAMAVGVLTAHLSGFSQQLVPTPGEVPDDSTGHYHPYQEVIIRQKTGKDAKVTVEIRNGELFINGKPASEYDDDNLAITKRKVRKDNLMYLDGGDLNASPFKDQWFYDNAAPKENKAFLGVVAAKVENGGIGASVVQIAAGSAAENVGLKLHDIIIKVDELAIEKPGDLSHVIGEYNPGDKVTLTYLRDGKEQKVTVTLGAGKGAGTFRFDGPNGAYNLDRDGFDKDFFKQVLPPGYNYNLDNNKSPKLGIRAQDIENGKGAKVLYVDGQSAAARAGVKEQDIITAFDGHPVSDATTLAALARESHLKPSVKVNVLRDGKPLELEIKNPLKLKSVDL